MRYKFNNKQEEEICRRYLNFEGSCKLAKEFQCSSPTIIKTLKRNGITIRTLKEANRSAENLGKFAQKGAIPWNNGKKIGPNLRLRKDIVKGGTEYDLGYLLGAIQSDGGVSTRDYGYKGIWTAIQFNVTDLDFAQAIQNCFLQLYGFEPTIRKYSFFSNPNPNKISSPKKKYNRLTLTVVRKNIIENVIGFWDGEISATKSHTGKIPTLTSMEMIRGYLAGFFDGDGSVSDSRMAGARLRFTIYSEKLVQGIIFLLNKNGLKGRAYKRNTFRQLFDVGILGGRGEIRRFLEWVQPKISRKSSVRDYAYQAYRGVI